MAEKLSGVAELNTAEYLCTCMHTFESELQFQKWNIPFTGKRFMIAYDGVVKAGIRDLSRAQILQKDGHTLLILLPPIEITGQYLDPDSLVVYDESHNPLNQIRVEDVNDAQALLEEEMVQRALDAGLLDTAQTNARVILTALLQCDELRDYTLLFDIQR